MLTNFITWNVNPEIFRIGNFAIRWYGLLFALSFYFGYVIISRFFKKEKIPAELLDKLTIYMVIGTIVGARLGHCLFYEPHYYLSNPVEILKIWHGGLASHGAAIGILLALYIFSRKTKKHYFWVLDRIVIVVALSGFLIRTGNLMNSEIIGNPTNMPWAFVFTRIDNIPRHPAQIYESLSYLLIFIFLYQYYYKKNAFPAPGFLFAMFLILVFGARFFIEFFKDVQVNFERSMSLDMGQLLSIPLIITGIIILFWSIKNNKSKNIESNKNGHRLIF